MRKHLSTIVFVLIFLVGLSVMLYPSFSDWWNSHIASHSIATYQDAVAQLDNGEAERMLAQAHAYNQKLAGISSPFINFEEVSGYEDILNISGTGIMGYISIPSIKVELPVYHGTSEGVLQIAAGHLQGSSLPVGGENTHAVISGHRGLPSARLFTDLDKMTVGDTFTITVLNEVLTYEVEEILVILPTESDKLEIISGGDYVTLVTCTPYGVNSHRLLLRSKRIDTVYESRVRISADAVQVDPMKVMPFAAVPLLLILMIIWNISGRKKKNKTLEEMRKNYKKHQYRI
ncbi:MAG: class C sortase [Oscillospiraceae bacterium]|nr:class C sortase [Oscillospiraceae bacterium]